MKVLLVNKFLFAKGGDAVSTLATGGLLNARGHEVSYWGMSHPSNPLFPLSRHFMPHVDYNAPSGVFSMAGDALNIIYSFEAKKRIARLLDEIRPDVAHLNNIAHQISPSILDVLREKRVPVVMTLHDYKLVCPYYNLMSGSLPCERCAGGRFYNCLLRRCTKGSRLKSLVNTIEMYLHHGLLHIYDKVDCFISPSVFLKEKVSSLGFKGDVTHIYNFVDPAASVPLYDFKEPVIVYAGRLSTEKGVETLIDAVKGLNLKLRIAGDGPLKEGLAAKIAEGRGGNVELLGHMAHASVADEIRAAMFFVMPSIWYENNPLSVIESFALGKPVIGARIGGIPELVRDGETGLCFEPGDPVDLRKKIEHLASNSDKIKSFGKNARRFAEERLDPGTHYRALMQVYERAIKKAKAR